MNPRAPARDEVLIARRETGRDGWKDGWMEKADGSLEELIVDS